MNQLNKREYSAAKQLKKDGIRGSWSEGEGESWQDWELIFSRSTAIEQSGT